MTVSPTDSPLPRIGYSEDTAQPSINVSFVEGDSPGTFVCTARGYPEPQLSWRYSGGDIPPGITHTAVQGQLQWNRPISFADEGVYSCVATNEINTTEATLNVLVKGQCAVQ